MTADLPLEPMVSMDYNTPDESRVDYLSRVEASGIKVVVPLDNEIQIDIDGETQWKLHRELLSMLSDKGTWVNINNVLTKPSRSGDPYKLHVTITFDRPITMWERIAWQACLGSDLKRELFSCVRYRNNEIFPVCFFEKKDDNA